MALAGFDSDYYLAAKLAALQAEYTEWADKDAAFLETVLENSYGLTPEEHYTQYGWEEGLAPNAYFDADEYVLAKATALFNAGGYISISAAQEAFLEAWTDDPYQHYVLYGAGEGVNPSNAFDAEQYYADKLAALQADEGTADDWADKTVDDLKAYFEDAGITALEHFILYGEDEGLAAPAVPLDEQVTPDGSQSGTGEGEAFTLTTGVDILTGTSGNDTFVGILSGALGTGTTAQPGDQITGGAGDDSLTINVSGNAGAAFTLASLTTTGVETLNISNYDSNAAATTIDLSTHADVTAVGLVGSGDNGDTVFSNVTQIVEASAKGSGDLTVDYSAAAVTGESDNQVLNVDTYTGKFTVEEAETVTINATGGDSTLTALDTDNGTQDATTLTITGSADLTITEDLTTNSGAVKTIDASAATGDVTLTSSDDTTSAVTLGSGDDKLIRNNQDDDTGSADSFDGGDGTDTLQVTDGANISTTNLANYSNFEVLVATAAGGSAIDLTGISMFTQFVTADATTGGQTTVTLEDDVAVAIVAGTADEDMAVENATDSSADALSLSIGATVATGAAVNFGNLGVNDFETVTIATVNTDNSIAQLNSTSLKTLNLSGAKDLTIAAGTAANLVTIDASTMTGDLDWAAIGHDDQTITTGSGDDTVNLLSATTSDDTVDTGDGDDTVVGVEGKDSITLGAGNDSLEIEAFADLTSDDTIDGGDGTDKLIFSEDANHNFTVDVTTLNGVSNIEQYEFNGLGAGGARTVSINDTIMADSAVTINFAAGVAGANATLDASAVLQTGSTVNFTDNSGEGASYVVGNGVDNVNMGAGTDTVTVNTHTYLTATDTIAGGTGADTLVIAIDGGATSATTITKSSDDLAGVSGFETINITADDANDYIKLTITDDLVAANQANNALTFGSTADDENAIATLDASGVTSTVALTFNGGAVVDTIKTGAGDDFVSSNGGIDKIILDSGSNDTIIVDSEAAANADEITGFIADSSETNDFDVIQFTAGDGNPGAELLNATGDGHVVLAATDATDVAGTVVALDATDYNEISAGGDLLDNHVNVIKGTGYASLNAALVANGGDTGDADDLAGMSFIAVFYNTSTQVVEMYHVENADGDGAGDDGVVTETATLIGSFTDIGLSGVADFSEDNFEVISLG